MSENLRGIIAILGASVAFILNDSVVKLMSAEIPVGELIALRGILATVFIMACAAATGGLASARVLLEPVIATRIVTAAFATLFIVLSLKYNSLAIYSAILQVTPIMVTLGSAALLGEKVIWQRWLAIALGFTGMMLIVKPTPAGFNSYVILPVIALLFTAARDLTTRLIRRSVSTFYVAGMSSALITVFGFGFLPYETWVWPSAKVWAQLVFTAVCLVFAYTLIVYAMRTGEVSAVAPFRYTTIPMAIGLGYLFWGDIPDRIATLGIAIIIGAGLYSLRYENMSRVSKPVATEQTPETARPWT